MESRVHPLFDLKDKVAVVTGGGSGLGREYCSALSEFGADVVCVDIRKDRAEETCKLIKIFGHKTLAVETDITKYDQVRSMFKLIDKTFGRIDVLINNAGIAPASAAIDQIDVREWRKVIDVNINGTFYCLREGLRIMVRQKKGSIINIASSLALCSIDPDILAVAPYVASKYAVVGLTKQSAVEYGRYGIRVNAIVPGWYLDTNLGKVEGKKQVKGTEQQLPQYLISRIPMKRLGDPKDLKGLIVFLASDSSSNMTGALITNDGGYTCL
jgi:NAD(P)-dependent dehydrogenase (short-subunit alcohol dehydrogenase family)